MLNRDKDVKPILITPAEHELLSLSDSIARSRLAASAGANNSAPLAYNLGIITLFVTALGTLFVTLQGKMKGLEEPENYEDLTVGGRVVHKLFGLGSGFRWVAFMAITLSIAGTSLTGLRQIFDPTRTLTQNTRAVLDLHQLHQELISGIQCGSDGIASNRNWQRLAESLRRMRSLRQSRLGQLNPDRSGGRQRQSWVTSGTDVHNAADVGNAGIRSATMTLMISDSPAKVAGSWWARRIASVMAALRLCPPELSPDRESSRFNFIGTCSNGTQYGTLAGG